MKKKIISVIWHDAQSLDEWTFSYDVGTDLAEVHSVGFLIKKSKKAITMALNHDTSNDSYSCMITIPKTWIKEMKDI